MPLLTSLELRNYRSFPLFRLNGLRRVNLLVGENNAGKTSILEAINILAFGTSPLSLWRIMQRRNERLSLTEDGSKKTELEVAHFFHGHTAAIGSTFGLRGGPSKAWGVDATIISSLDAFDFSFGEDAGLSSLDEQVPRSGLALRMKAVQSDALTTMRLTMRGGLSESAIQQPLEIETDEPPVPALFIPIFGLSAPTLNQLWERAVLEGKEHEISDSLRIVEPSLKDVQYVSGVADFFVGIQNETSRVPLGSLGDGTKRLLALALAVRGPRGGYLLVDDIDTGLHYTILPKMWRLIVATARRFDVQVIATTHSEDCVRSLAALCESSPELADDVALHRIEKGFPQSTAFTAEELAIGTRQQMEFR